MRTSGKSMLNLSPVWFFLAEAIQRVNPDGAWTQDLSIVHPTEQMIEELRQFNFFITLRRGAIVDFQKRSNSMSDEVTTKIVRDIILGRDNDSR